MDGWTKVEQRRSSCREPRREQLPEAHLAGNGLVLAKRPHTAGGAALSRSKQSKWTPGQARGDNTLVFPGSTRNPFLFDKSLRGRNIRREKMAQ
jgi:hypothetical protein